MFKKIVAGLAILSAIATGVYLLLIRPWHLRWGATDEEAATGQAQQNKPAAESRKVF